VDAVKLSNLGTIVTWGSPANITLSELRNALTSAGLEPDLARELLPRNAFSRAAKEMEEGRIIQRFNEDASSISFQFTKSEVHSHGIKYDREAVLVLDKASGRVTCTDSVLESVAQAEVDKQMGHRNAGDVTRLVQKVFDNHKGDLVPLRKGGGVYFVPNTHQALVEQVWHFLLSIGGRMSRFAINAGDTTTEGSVADSLVEHFTSMIDDLHKEIGEVDLESPADAISRRRDQIELLKTKLSCYRFLLQDTAETIEKQINLAQWEYNNRVGIKNDWEPSADDLPDLDDLIGGMDDPS
jgi:hypothetical protein